ncbi:hypothetical protein [Hymenobacter norwichensis]|uniref:hypothetical protein n=1 Tax=Hymenobacter norwichensis TaxID=223903 RepID=UPI000526E7F4|nr:hypothetical protein [Hymenobacter norwichensis]
MGLAINTATFPITASDSADLHLYLQWYKAYLSIMREMVTDNPRALEVLLLLMEKCDKTNTYVGNQAQLAKSLGKHRNTVSKAVEYLQAHQLIQLFKLGTTNGYRLNAQLVWQGSVSERSKAKFSEEPLPVGRKKLVQHFKQVPARAQKAAQVAASEGKQKRRVKVTPIATSEPPTFNAKRVAALL